MEWKMTKNNQNNSNENHNILIALLAGSVIGVITAALINSSKGKEIREDLYDAYHDASKKVSNAAHKICEKSHDISDKFLGEPQKSCQQRNLAIGAVAGGILGISTILFMTCNSTKGLREQAFHTFECLSDKAHCLEDKVHSTNDRFEENVSYWINKAEQADRKSVV